MILLPTRQAGIIYIGPTYTQDQFIVTKVIMTEHSSRIVSCEALNDLPEDKDEMCEGLEGVDVVLVLLIRTGENGISPMQAVHVTSVPASSTIAISP